MSAYARQKQSKGVYLIFLCLLLACERPDPPTLPATQTQAMASYTAADIAYFLEVALGSEFGPGGRAIVKWEGQIPLQVRGTPTEADQATLAAVIEDVNGLTGGHLTLRQTEGEGAITMWFVPVDEMSRYEPNYVSGNYGFFWTWWRSDNTIYRANILIGTDRPTQAERSHLIREELTQSLGLMNDSNRYEESIFYQGWTATQRYAPIDRTLLEILYRPEVKRGMRRAELERLLPTLQ